jgi:hypothetical protein
MRGSKFLPPIFGMAFRLNGSCPANLRPGRYLVQTFSSSRGISASMIWPVRLGGPRVAIEQAVHAELVVARSRLCTIQLHGQREA